MHFKFSQITFLLSFCIQVCYGQKLPDVQQNSVSAPSSIKADGKNLEWNDTFQASNKRTGLQYTLANDQENLYLVVKSTDAASSNKIIAGGIELSINTDGKRKEKEGFKIIYPLVKRSVSRSSTSRSSSRTSGFSQRTEQTAKQRDSMMLEMRKAQLAQVKEIKIHGFSIPDTLISIYNEYRLKAFSSFDEKGAFFYELSVPLKLLGLSPQSTGEFAYNIKVRGMQMEFSRIGGGGNERQSSRSSSGNFGGGGGIDIQSLMSATDFWGSYKLAK
jgi:hypothetical protein